MTSLSGIAWRQIEHLVDKASEAEDGFMLILSELDKTFQYDDQVEMPRAFEKFFYHVNRRDGQALINYVADHWEHLLEVERHGVQIPDKVAGWLLLRRAGLTMEQKQLVQGRAKDLDQTGVAEALYFLFEQEYKGKRNEGRSWRGKGYGSSSRWTRHQGYNAEEIYEADDAEALGEPFDDYGFTHCKAMMLPLFNKKEKFCWCKIRQFHLYLWKYDFNPFRAETITLKTNNLIFESVFYTILGWNF